EGVARFVFDFAVPALLFRAMATADVFDNPPWTLWAAFFPASLTVFFIGMVLARTAFARPVAGAAITGMGSCFGNTVLLGIPINIRVLGDAAMVPTLLVIAVHGLVLMTLTTVILESGRAGGRGSKAALAAMARGMLTHPSVIGLMTGLAWNVTGLAIPALVDEVLVFMKGAVVPCSLFALGATLARYGIKGRVAQSATVTALKLIVMPALAWVTARMLGLDAFTTAALVLLAAQPTGINMYLFASRYETAEAIASTTVFVSTLASVLVLPVLIFLVAPGP
ncbi:MAG: AEC family transporter, partial [Rhodospirillaceae bacterium]